MRDEQMLQRIGEASGKHLVDDPAWDKLADGTITPEELESLRQRAKGDPRAQEMFEAFAPIGEARREVIESLFHGAPSEDLSTQRDPDHNPVVSLAAHRTPQATPQVRWFAAVASMAAAAALIFVFWGDDPGAVLPQYQLEFQGGLSPVRSAPMGTVAEAPVTLSPVSQFTITLRPATRSDVAPVLQAFVERPDGTRGPIELPVETAPSGTLILRDQVGKIFGPQTGTYTLHFFISPPDVPVPGDLSRLLAEKSDNQRWQTFSQKLVVQPE